MAGQGVENGLAAAAAAFASNARNPNLRRAQLSYLGIWAAGWAFTVGLGIVAYCDGGATAVGLVGLVRMLPSAVVAPLVAPLADRGRRERVLVLVSALRFAAIGAAAVVVGVDGPPEIVYALAVCPPSRSRSTARRIRRCFRRCVAPDTSWPVPMWCAVFWIRLPR